ncbi:major capsid protein [Dipodfec virus UOA04_Rod_967]|nr:major capsid protein [Dipodfec virus UOA04_Rod_967]
MGQLVPFFCEPVLPSDRFRVSSEHLVRFAPLQSPIMSNVDVYVHFFFVPNRLIWSDWEKFITGADKGKKLDEEEIPSPPFVNLRSGQADLPLRPIVGSGSNQTSVGVGSWSFPPLDAQNKGTRCLLENGNLADFLGFQSYSSSELTKIGDSGNNLVSYSIDTLPFRAYQRIWFDYYRDENLTDVEDYESLIGGDWSGDLNVRSDSQLLNLSGLFSLRQRAWRKDYFTSALPWAQKGDDVLIPGSSSGSFDPSNLRIVGNGSIQLNAVGSGTPVNLSFSSSNGANETATKTLTAVPTTGNQYQLYGKSTNDASSRRASLVGHLANVDASAIASSLSLSSSSLLADNVSEGTIRELRRAFAAQAFLERRAVGGTRYNEQILAFFGVRTSDGRLQRAEFLGGSKQPVVVSQVLQTSESTSDSPLGEPAGTAVSAGGKYIFDRQFEEYGFVVGIMSVVPRADYMSGIPRKYQKRDVYDYYWPQFARIGEQEIKSSELYFDFLNTGSNINDSTFGYAPRYSEYRFINNSIHGDFRASLDYWNLGRKFNETPRLNENFITCRPSSRIYAYTGNDFSHLWVDIHVNCRALRPLPKYAESY